MRRFTWLATVVAVFALAGQATAQDMPMRVGVIGGVNFADLTGDNVDDTDLKTGFDVGVLAQFPLGMVLTFQPEVHYTQKGATDAASDEDFELTYIDIPLLLRAGTMLAEGLDVDLLIGPSISINVGCDAAGTDCGDTLLGDPESTDFGLVLGAGFSWAMGAGDLLVDGRFTMGFSDIWEDVDAKNQNIQLLIGYAFPFGR